MDKEQKEIELRKIEIELNLYKELFKAVLFVLTADIGGTITIMLNFKNYNETLAIILITLGVFTALGLLYVVSIILFEIRRLKGKLED